MFAAPMMMKSAAAVGAFNPVDLFGTGDKGLVIDPSDISSLWIDTGKTANVSADGQAVAVIEDLAGKTTDLSQATAARQALYKTSGGLHWLLSDGSNDFYPIASSFITNSKDVTLVAAMSMEASGDYPGLLRGAQAATGFALIFRQSQRRPRPAVWTTSGTVYSDANVSLSLGQAHVLTEFWDRSTGILTFDRDRAEVVNTSGTPADIAPPTTVYELFRGVGSDAQCLAAKLYFLCIIDRELTVQELADLEDYAAAKSGVTL